MEKKGFTLIELLIVIGILAVLATVTLLVLNPAQMFAQARDSQRVSDLNTIKAAISLYLSTASSPYLDHNSGSDCGTYIWGTQGTTSVGSVAYRLFADAGKTTFKGATGTTTVSGNGWVPVVLSDTTGGAAIASLPLDPTGLNTTLNSNNNALYSYYYTCSSTGLVFEIDANMESSRYASGGTDDKESVDGGDRSYEYEVGTALNL